MWTISDGTIVRLGGEVEGASLFALQLRTTIDAGEAGITWPGRDYPVDVNDLAQLDAFVRERAKHVQLKVSGPKDVPALQPPPDPPELEGLPDSDDGQGDDEPHPDDLY